MKPFSPDEIRLMFEVLDAPTAGIVKLTRIAGLDPARAYLGADLSAVDFGKDDLTGFRFDRARLYGAKLAAAKGLRAEMLAGAAMDSRTELPAHLRHLAVQRRPSRGSTWSPREPFAVWRETIPGLPAQACPEMVTIPAGSFLMGAPADEEDSRDDERPQRVVTVPQPFALGRYAVTFAQWDAAIAAGAKLPKVPDQDWGREDRPVINVSWKQARMYCAWLNRRLGLKGAYRLPSEAEWEYACRAGTTTPFSFGETISPQHANYDANFTYGAGAKGEYRERTVPVGSLPANACGLHEMHGNVWNGWKTPTAPIPTTRLTLVY